jgi:tRNA threonylcarbamoyladenosine biosynthesis protein TsaE
MSAADQSHSNKTSPIEPIAFHLRDRDETQQLGEVLGDLLADAVRHAGAVCVLLSGDLGAGKTTFVRGLARGLGCDEGAVASPTFTLRMDHRGSTRALAHIDAWRIGPEDLASIGWDELVEGNPIIALEWPERLAGHLPARSVRVSLDHAEPAVDQGEPGRIACIDLGGLPTAEARRIDEGLRLLVRAARVAPPTCPTCGRTVGAAGGGLEDGREAGLEGGGASGGESGAGAERCSTHAPFCSRRCRMADLGDWLLMRHRIAGSETPEFDE